MLVAPRAAAEERDAPDLSLEVREAVDVVQKAPLVLLLATGEYRKNSGRWPSDLRDLNETLGENRRVLPHSFVFREVKFTHSNRKECVVDFAFDWPALEGGGAAGSIAMTASSSVQTMAKTAKVTWKKKPAIRADLLPAPKSDGASKSGSAPSQAPTAK